MNIFFYIKIVLILLFLFILYRLIYENQNQNQIQIKNIENFEDKFDEQEIDTYHELYDKEFVDLYEIIYRDFSDIDYDYQVVSSKIMNNIKNKEDINILVCGSGVGKLCKKIKDKYKNVVGVDISENMLKKSQLLYPNIKFIRGNISKKKLFDKNTFSHIFLDERTLYYNEYNDMEKIIQNCFYWIKENGFLIIPIYDPTKLQLASRYYSTKYIDNKGNVHGFTYLNDFSHDCYYIKEDGIDGIDETNHKETDIFHYFDKIILEDGKKRVKKTVFHIPPKEKIYDLIMNNGFEIYYTEKIRLQIVGGYELVIFRKKKTIISVDEIQKNNIK
jgi:ubiquinone/menaquinone biosynthesis C-methylase UbiE